MANDKKEKGVQVNATIPPAWNNALEEHKWKARMKKTDLVKTAVQEYMVNHGLIDQDGNVLIQTPGPESGQTITGGEAS